MNWRIILTIFLKELKDSLRDRRTLISTIIIPTFAMPILFWGAGTVVTKTVTAAKKETSSVVIVGGQDSPEIVAAIRAEPRFRVINSDKDFRELISNKTVRVAIGIPDGFDAALKNGEPKTVTLYHYEGELKSGMGATDVENFLRSLRDKTIAARLEEKGLAKNFVRPFELKHENVAPSKQVGGNIFGGIIPYLMILLCFTGAMYPGIDLTAGEKERGTMETLMCSPVNRINIVLGKFLLVVTASVSTIVFSVVSMGGSLLIVGIPFAGNAALRLSAGNAKGGFSPMIDPWGIPGVFAMIAPLAVLFASVILAVSLAAKSYKEAQSYVSPLVLLVVLPAMFGILPGVELDAKTALVPILNITLACKEMLSGIWHWEYIALIFLSSCLFAGIALGFCVRMFNREEVIFRA